MCTPGLASLSLLALKLTFAHAFVAPSAVMRDVVGTITRWRVNARRRAARVGFISFDEGGKRISWRRAATARVRRRADAIRGELYVVTRSYAYNLLYRGERYKSRMKNHVDKGSGAAAHVAYARGGEKSWGQRSARWYRGAITANGAWLRLISQWN